MQANAVIRQLHRWISIAFVATVLVNVVVLLVLQQEPPAFVYLLPLAPLAVLMASGLYLFALPHLRRRPSTGA